MSAAEYSFPRGLELLKPLACGARTLTPSESSSSTEPGLATDASAKSARLARSRSAEALLPNAIQGERVINPS